VSTGDTVTIPIVVDDVTNLGAFEFQVSFDATILRAEKAEPGPFLGSSGRQVHCLEPSIGENLVRLVCVTLGATPAGPDGSGVLATLEFKPVGAGTSPLRFERLVFTDPPAKLISTQARDGSIAVVSGSDGGGFAWALWVPIIGGVLAALVAAGIFTWWIRRPQQPPQQP
jgi:hypothetical protein